MPGNPLIPDYSSDYFGQASQAGTGLGQITSPYFKDQMPLSPFEQHLADVLSGKLEPEMAARQYQATKGGMGPGLGAQNLGQAPGGPVNMGGSGLDRVYDPQQNVDVMQVPMPLMPQQAPQGRAPAPVPRAETRRDMQTLMAVRPQMFAERQHRDYLAEQKLRNEGAMGVAGINAGAKTGAAETAAGASKYGADKRGEAAGAGLKEKQREFDEMMKHRRAALQERGAYHDKLAKAAYARVKMGQGSSAKLRAAVQQYGIASANLRQHVIDMNKNPRQMDHESDDYKAFVAAHDQLQNEKDAAGEALKAALEESGTDVNSIDMTFGGTEAGSSGASAGSSAAVRPPAGIPAPSKPPPPGGKKSPSKEEVLKKLRGG